MGKKKTGANAGGGSMRRDMIRKGGNKSRKRDEYVFRTAEDIIASEKQESGSDRDSDDGDEGGKDSIRGATAEMKDLDLRSSAMTSCVYMWEFGQNDTKRDSGSKLCRLGYASTLRFNTSFNGIVLSSEGKGIISPADLEIIQQYGLAGKYSPSLFSFLLLQLLLQ